MLQKKPLHFQLSAKPHTRLSWHGIAGWTCRGILSFFVKTKLTFSGKIFFLNSAQLVGGCYVVPNLIFEVLSFFDFFQEQIYLEAIKFASTKGTREVSQKRGHFLKNYTGSKDPLDREEKKYKFFSKMQCCKDVANHGSTKMVQISNRSWIKLIKWRHSEGGN